MGSSMGRRPAVRRHGPRPIDLGVTERALLELVKHEPWEGTGEQLVRQLGKREAWVWSAVVGLAELGALKTTRTGSSVRIVVTQQGRAMMVRKRGQRRDGGARSGSSAR